MNPWDTNSLTTPTTPLTIDTLPHHEGFVPVITSDDMDSYVLFRQHNYYALGMDPRDEVNDAWELMHVMDFLCQTAEFKSMKSETQLEHFEYETLSYGYGFVRDYIAEM